MRLLDGPSGTSRRGRNDGAIIVTLRLIRSRIKSLIERRFFVSRGPQREVKAATNSHLHELLLREKASHLRTHVRRVKD